MTAVLDAARLVELGWCPSCYALGQPVPVASGQARCRTHLAAERLVLTADRSGQFGLGVPTQARRRPVYPTGQQAACVRCAAAGVDRQGLSRDGAGSDPLCMSCWLGPRERRAAGQRRRLVAELRERLDVDEPTGCAVCGLVEPSPDCWLCGHSWLARVRQEFEAERAAAAAEAARVAVAQAEAFARLAEVTEAEARVDELRAWLDLLATTVAEYRAGRSRGRPVEWVADLLARDAAARANRMGRPSALGEVGAVLAVSGNYRTGAGHIPGRDRTTWLTGRSRATVTAMWARGEAAGWCRRTRRGRRLTLRERKELGRTNDRSEYTITFLHFGDPAARAAQVPAALRVFAALMEYATGLLADAEQALDAARARADGWTDAPEIAHRARMRRAVTQAVTGALTHAEAIDHHRQTFLPPPSGTRGEYVSSCLSRGFSFSPSIASPPPGGRRTRRGEKGASRSPARTGRADREGGGPPRLQRPRPHQEACASPPAARRRPEWSRWAFGLAEALQRRWSWTEKIPLPRLAAILGPRLGPGWNPGGGHRDDEARRTAIRGADALVAFVDRARPIPVLNDPDTPTGYLVRILEEALTSGEQPPYPAARAEAHQREQEAAHRALVAARAAAQREHQDAVRAERTAQEQAAVRPGQRSAAAEAALAAIRARTSGHLRRADRAALIGDAPAADDAPEWPEVARPGGGLPPTLDR